MKPPKHTIQWLAPHLSDGEVQAIYEAMLGVIGEDDSLPTFKEWYGKTKAYGGTKEEYNRLWLIENNENNLRTEQRAALNRLFGKESG